jgi:hypothetical protein
MRAFSKAERKKSGQLRCGAAVGAGVHDLPVIGWACGWPRKWARFMRVSLSDATRREKIPCCPWSGEFVTTHLRAGFFPGGSGKTGNGRAPFLMRSLQAAGGWSLTLLRLATWKRAMKRKQIRGCALVRRLPWQNCMVEPPDAVFCRKATFFARCFAADSQWMSKAAKLTATYGARRRTAPVASFRANCLQWGPIRPAIRLRMSDRQEVDGGCARSPRSANEAAADSKPILPEVESGIAKVCFSIWRPFMDITCMTGSRCQTLESLGARVPSTSRWTHSIASFRYRVSGAAFEIQGDGCESGSRAIKNPERIDFRGEMQKPESSRTSEQKVMF